MAAVATSGWTFYFMEEVMASTFTRRQALAGSCMGAALFLAPGVAHAVTRYAVVSIANETQTNVLLGYRWGDSETWHQINLGPGAKHWWSHTFAKPNENKAPPFYIRFDSDTSAKRYIEPWKLTGRAAAEQLFELGNKYALRYDGPTRRYIEIFDVPG
jgi:hypothetical protein